MNSLTSSPDPRDGDSGEVTCLLQYVIKVDDDAMSEKRDQRKISSNFTTEVAFAEKSKTIGFLKRAFDTALFKKLYLRLIIDDILLFFLEKYDHHPLTLI